MLRRGLRDDLEAMPIIRSDHLHVLHRVWSLRSNVTACDAAYLVLAEALGARLVTCDAAPRPAASDPPLPAVHPVGDAQPLQVPALVPEYVRRRRQPLVAVPDHVLVGHADRAVQLHRVLARAPAGR